MPALGHVSLPQAISHLYFPMRAKLVRRFLTLMLVPLGGVVAEPKAEGRKFDCLGLLPAVTGSGGEGLNDKEVRPCHNPEKAGVPAVQGAAESDPPMPMTSQ